MQVSQATIERLGAVLTVMFAVAFGGAIGCGGNQTGSAPSVGVELYGWSEEGEFVEDLSSYPDARVVTVKLTQPSQRRIVSSKQFDIASGKAELPTLTFGEGLRLEFDLIDADGNRIGSAATSQFTLRPDSSSLSLEAMVVPTRDFAPVGGRYAADNGDKPWAYQATDFDGRGFGETFPGRVGHEAVKTSQGNVLIVAGGHPSSHPPSLVPTLREALGDLQLFEPDSGYTTDLSFDQQTGQRRPDGADRLSTPRAYHTVTPIGDDLFVVIGGLTGSGDSTTPTASIELIDLRATPGERVRKLTGPEGQPLELQTARAFHTATYRRAGNHIVVAGGVGSGETANALSSIEIVDLDEKSVRSAAQDLNRPRAEHEAVLMDDDKQTIWILGGRHHNDEVGATATTELVRACESGGERSICSKELDALKMSTPRYDFAAARIDRGLIAVCGGYTEMGFDNGSPSNQCQLGRLDRKEWSSRWEWSMMHRRGGADIVPMTQSRDFVVVGGRDSEGETVASTERMVASFGENPPYIAESRNNSMVETRYNPTVTRLDNGLILLTGGMGEGNTRRSLEYYNPADIVRARGVESQSDEQGETDG